MKIPEIIFRDSINAQRLVGAVISDHEGELGKLTLKDGDNCLQVENSCTPLKSSDIQTLELSFNNETQRRVGEVFAFASGGDLSEKRTGAGDNKLAYLQSLLTTIKEENIQFNLHGVCRFMDNLVRTEGSLVASSAEREIKDFIREELVPELIGREIQGSGLNLALVMTKNDLEPLRDDRYDSFKVLIDEDAKDRALKRALGLETDEVRDIIASLEAMDSVNTSAVDIVTNVIKLCDLTLKHFGAEVNEQEVSYPPKKILLYGEEDFDKQIPILARYLPAGVAEFVLNVYTYIDRIPSADRAPYFRALEESGGDDDPLVRDFKMNFLYEQLKEGIIDEDGKEELAELVLDKHGYCSDGLIECIINGDYGALIDEFTVDDSRDLVELKSLAYDLEDLVNVGHLRAYIDAIEPVVEAMSLNGSHSDYMAAIDKAVDNIKDADHRN
ncbi:MAG: hypothetical protein O3C63_04085 [Cyanobacteria bacterium]|nr:hypothetical protein [Cyanobacteriota bacterium]MDA1021649.1 hypothetical protein [Cyanobacteriota bacterium]